MWGGRHKAQEISLLNEALHLNAEGEYLRPVRGKSHSFKSKTGTSADKKPQNKTTKPAFSKSPPVRSEQQQRGGRKLRASRDGADIFPVPELLADSSRNLKPHCVPGGLSGESCSRSLPRTITRIPNAAARMRSPCPPPDGAGWPPRRQPRSFHLWVLAGIAAPLSLSGERARGEAGKPESPQFQKEGALPQESSCETQTTPDLRVHSKEQNPGLWSCADMPRSL